MTAVAGAENTDIPPGRELGRTALEDDGLGAGRDDDDTRLLESPSRLAGMQQRFY